MDDEFLLARDLLMLLVGRVSVPEGAVVLFGEGIPRNNSKAICCSLLIANRYDLQISVDHDDSQIQFLSVSANYYIVEVVTIRLLLTTVIINQIIFSHR